METKVTLHSNPLQMPEIIEQIFTYLDLKTLRNAHIVNRLWESESTRQIIPKTYISTPRGFYHKFFDVSHSKTPTEYKTGIKNQCKKEFKRRYGRSHWNRTPLFTKFRQTYQEEQDRLYNIAFSEQSQYQNLSLNSLSRLFTSSDAHVKTINLLVKDKRDVNFFLTTSLIPKDKVKELKYDPRDAKFHWANDESLYRLLKHFTNLQVLDISCLHLYPWDETSNFENKLNQLLQLIQKLKIIKLTPSVGNFPRLVQLQAHLTNVSSLNLNRWNSLSILSNFVNSKVQWSLAEVNLYLDGNLTLEISRNFFAMISKSLKHLRLEGVRCNESVTAKDNWHVPLSLVNLECLEIGLKDSNEAGRRKTCTIGLQLPKLKKLMAPLDAFFNLPLDLSSSQNIAKLEYIEFIDNGHCVSLEPTLCANFSHLKSLKIHLDLYWNFTRAIANVILNQFINLEQLELTLTANIDWIEDDEETTDQFPNNWEEVLIRNDDDEFDRTKGIQIDQQSTASIQNLQNLRCLRISTDDSRKLATVLSDTFIYKGLWQLKNLQLFQTPENYFSDRAIQFLKNKMGPSFNFYNTKNCDQIFVR